MKKRLFLRLLSITLCFVLLFFCFDTGTLALTGGYTIYVNDEPWYTQSLYDWQKKNQVYYVPIATFLKINGVNIITNKDLNTVTISYGTKYISIDTSENIFAYTEEYGEFYFKTFALKSGILFVPALTVCNYFGFSFSVYGDDEAIRICDGNEKMTFYETLLIYNPNIVIKTNESYKYNPLNSDDDIAYFAVELDKDNIYYAEQILSAADEFGYKLTFFADYETIVSCPDLIRKIIISSSEIGVVCKENARDINDITEELCKCNEALFGIAKTKSRLALISEDTGFIVSDEDVNKIKAYGFMLWSFDINSNDKYLPSGESVVQNVIEKITGYKSFSVVFHSRKVSKNAITIMFNYMQKNTDYKLIAIDNTQICPKFKDIYSE